MTRYRGRHRKPAPPLLRRYGAAVAVGGAAATMYSALGGSLPALEDTDTRGQLTADITPAALSAAPVRSTTAPDARPAGTVVPAPGTGPATLAQTIAAAGMAVRATRTRTPAPPAAAASAPAAPTLTASTTSPTGGRHALRSDRQVAARAAAPTRGTTRPAAPTTGQACSSTLAGTRPHVARAGNALAKRFGIPRSRILGYRPNAVDKAGHPAGLALDFMVNRSDGDALAAYVLAHRDELGAKYVIWRQRYNDGRGWSRMDDRGGDTANHMDHVHITFNRAAPTSPVRC